MGGQSCSLGWLLPTTAKNQQNLVIEQELCIDYLRNMRDYQLLDPTQQNRSQQSRSQLSRSEVSYQQPPSLQTASSLTESDEVLDCS